VAAVSELAGSSMGMLAQKPAHVTVEVGPPRKWDIVMSAGPARL